MTALLFIAYLLGGVMRYNIRYAEPLLTDEVDKTGRAGMHRMHKTFREATAFELEVDALRITERISHGVLAGAYFISISYYLQLLAAFALRIVGQPTSLWLSRSIVTGILLVLGVVGTVAGLRSFERIEKYVIAVNLSMISALLVGLAWHNGALLMAGDWSLPTRGLGAEPNHVTRVLMGLLIVVQGFETSRFLGAEHSPEERVRSMRLAQWLSSGIYLVFIGLITVMFASSSATTGSVTAIIGIASGIVPILGTLVAITAIGSQFTAATADDAGCAGLLETPVSRLMPGRYVYGIVAGFAILVTWLTDVYQIISFASRAFALFYACQCLVALLATLRTRADHLRRGHLTRVVSFSLLGLFSLAVAVFGIPAG
ncbi:MAG: hypothetical protein GXP55_26285 [Deltaproteobacteria bacterium]|nr:hypothetical protein [Deltaproteobacteria bacterium]